MNANPDSFAGYEALEKGMQVLGLSSDQHRETPIDLFVTEPFDFETEYANAYRWQLTSHEGNRRDQLRHR